MNSNPKVIKRDGQVGFREYRVAFNKGDQAVLIEKCGVGVDMPITDFLNLVEQATWYFDQFASREER